MGEVPEVLRRPFLRAVGCGLAIAVVSCGGFKNASQEDGGDMEMAPEGSAGGSGGGSGSGSGSGGNTGAGAWGDLPSGYCCTSDSDCRYRDCVDQGGGNKMCEDECEGPDACIGLLAGFSCVFGLDDFGLCTPDDASMACVPPAQYVHGTEGLGTCCAATGDATSGQECAGGRCVSFGVSDDNPFICTNDCDIGLTSECPGAYQCINGGDYNLCAPLRDPYTCP